MKTTKLFVFVAALLVGTTFVFAAPFQQMQHITQPLAFYDNAVGSNYNAMIAESPSIVFDGYNETIYMGPGGTTAPLSVLADGLAVGDLYVGKAAYITTVLGALSIGTMQTIGTSDATPDVSGYSYFITGSTGDTIDDFDGSTIAAGQLIFVESAGAIVYDIDGALLVCGTADVTTADGDLTVWVYNGTDWQCLAFMDLTDNNNTWGAA